MSWLTQPYALDFMQRALVASILVGATAPLVGTWIMLQRLTYLGDAMGHATLGGVAAAYLLGINLTIGAIAASLVMVGFISLLARHPRLDHSTVIGVAEVALFAFGLVLVSRSENVGVDLSHYLFGSITTVSAGDLWLNAALAAVVVGGCVLLWRDLRTLTFDPMHAQLSGIAAAPVRLALLTLLAITVVLALQTVGLLMSIALLILPAATARLATRTLLPMAIVASGIGVAVCVAGLTLSYHVGSAPGATIALVAVAVLTIVWALTVPRRARRAKEHSDSPRPPHTPQKESHGPSPAAPSH